MGRGGMGQQGRGVCAAGAKENKTEVAGQAAAVVPLLLLHSPPRPTTRKEENARKMPRLPRESLRMVDERVSACSMYTDQHVQTRLHARFWPSSLVLLICQMT